MRIFEGILDQLDAQETMRPADDRQSYDDFRWRVEVRFADGDKYPRVVAYVRETMAGIMEAFSEISDYHLDDDHRIIYLETDRLSDTVYFGIDFNIAEGVAIEKIYNRLVLPLSQLGVNVRGILFAFGEYANDFEHQVYVSDVDCIMMTAMKTQKEFYFQRQKQALFYIFRFFAYMSTDYMCASNPFSSELSPEHFYYDLILPVVFNPEWKKFWRSLPRKGGMRWLSGDRVYATSSYRKYTDVMHFDVFALTSKEMIVKLQSLNQMLHIADVDRSDMSDVLRHSVATKQKLFTEALFENVEPYAKLSTLWPALKKVDRLLDDCNCMRTPETYGTVIDELKRICIEDHDVVC